MRIGTLSPQWARDLMYKWVKLDDKFFGITHNVFIFYTDVLDPQVRIFAEIELSARNDVAGKREIGLFATYIEPDGFKVIETPIGLEQWTENFKKDLQANAS